MKRDMDLLRSILLEIESADYYGPNIEIKNISARPEELNFHLFLLYDAGLIQGTPSKYNHQIWPVSLSWKGCEFLEAAKDETRWNSAKKKLGEIGANVFEIMFRVLVETAAEQILRPK